MPATIPTERVDFRCRRIRCAAWLTLPAGRGPHPTVVLTHGLGATHDMMLPQYEQHFAAAGIATLAFDYRNTGASDGQPRQHISTRERCHDVAAAIEHLKSRPEVDGGRIGLWGTSLGGMNVIRVAAARDDVAVALVQCPIVHGQGAARRLGLRQPRCGSRPPSRRICCAWSPAAADGTCRSSAREEAARWSPSAAPNPVGIQRFRRAASSTTGSPLRTPWRWC
jgi:fermentation-respiration switch protein FrsA (DUF1100 family)